MCPQPPSWQAAAGAFNPKQLTATPPTLSTLHRLLGRSHAEGPGGPGRCWAKSPGSRGLRSRGTRPSLAPLQALRTLARGRSGFGQWLFLPREPAEGGPALLPVPPTAARARRTLGAGSRARPGRLSAAPTPASSKGRAAPVPARPSDWKDLTLRDSLPSATMNNLPATPSPEELMTTPVFQAPETMSPQAEEASTALIAVVITVVFLTLLSVVTLIFFYLYKNKGSYVTYEPAEGEPSTILQMETDSAKGKEKEEYFI